MGDGGQLRDVDDGHAVLAAERQALSEAQQCQHDGRAHADRVAGGGVVAGQASQDDGRDGNDEDGEGEGLVAAGLITDVAKHERADGADDEASCKDGPAGGRGGGGGR